VVGLDVVVTDGEERERAVRRELGIAASDRCPRRLDCTALREIDLESVAAGRFTIPGEEPDADPQAQNLWD
jgi:hypothetical protein